MRRLLLIFFVFVVLGGILALVFRDHHGYLLVSFNGWQIETSLLFAAGALLVFLWVVITLWRLIVAGALMPRNVRRGLGRRRARKARRSLYDGLLRLSEGRWSKAERELNRLAEKNEAPGLNYLHAARAAQHQGKVAERDRYLKMASGRPGASELAVLLTQAQLQTEQGQSAEALTSLSRLYKMEPAHPEVLRLYAGQALSVGDFELLRSLLPGLYKHAKIPNERVDALAIEAWHDELKRQSNDPIALSTAWKRVPKRLRASSDMTRRYVDCLRTAGADDQAADVIRDVLKREWDASLVLIFGDLKSDDRSAQLSTVERWLKHYGEEPELLLVAGRLCLRNRLWGRARSYFEASQKNQSRPEALLELGRLFEEINEKEEARAAYRQGLELKPQP